MQTVRFPFILIVFTLARSCGQQTGNHGPLSPLTPESVQGCYELTLSKWNPGFGEDEEFVTPPKRVNLIAEQGTKGFETRGYLLRPAPGEKPSIHRDSYWTIEKHDTVELHWTTGFSGLTAKLRRKDGALVGEARPFWDFPRRGQKTRLIARRIECAR